MDKDNNKLQPKKEWRMPYEGKVMSVIRSFSLTEKTIFLFFAGILTITAFLLLYRVNKNFLVEVPDYGGTISEGIIGSPRFINPLLASSDIDKDLTNLIYSGLLKLDTKGELVPDLAKSYTISNDGLQYDFILKDNLHFHDGSPLTVDDIVFTIEKAQDPALKSPREANWAGVVVQKISEKEISFILKQPYAPFIQNMTLGILPKAVWKDVSIEELPFSQFNIKPIGSGPYKISSLDYTSSGLPGQYNLESFNKYSLGKPFITNFVVKTYQNEKEIISAYKKGDIDSLHSISPKDLGNLDTKNNEVILAPLPRIFGVFFNQNVAPVFVFKEVRSALETATDKEAIVKNILNGYGQVINGPIPVKEKSISTETISPEERLQAARAILESKGWKLNSNGIYEKKEKSGTTKLSFSISTGSAPELKETALMLQQQWQKVGAEVAVKIFDIGDLNQNIIKTRKYDALLFGEIIGSDLDLYPFWHSSQRNSPGLNIAMYTNLKADKILESLRKTLDSDEQENLLEKFNDEIENDIPAVFTYSPDFIYIIPKKVLNVELGSLTSSSERFSDVNEWYIETNSIWEFFSKNN